MTDATTLTHITRRTQTSPEEFTFMAVARDFLTHSKIMHWLQSEFELEHGQATMISNLILPNVVETKRLNKLFAKQFKGSKADWLPAFDELAAKLNHFGADVQLIPAEDMILLQRSDNIFGLIKVSNQRLIIGINLPDAPFCDRFVSAKPWSNLVTHSTNVSVFQQINDELLIWLKAGYAKAL